MGRGRVRWCLLGLLGLLVTCVAAVGPAASARPAGVARPAATGALGHRGPFLTDPAGRVIFLHGVNVVYKHPPYVAPDTAAGFTARDADFLVAHGFNAVRLGVLFAG